MDESGVHRFLAAAIFTAGISLMTVLSGCGYTLMTKGILPFRTITVGVVENKTFQPKLQDTFSRVFAETLMQYGFEVVPSAQYLIKSEITRFELKTLSERDLTTAEYAITIRGNFTLTDAATNSTVSLMGVQNPFLTSFNASGPLENVLAQEQAATEVALRDLSEELVRRIVYHTKSGEPLPGQ